MFGSIPTLQKEGSVEFAGLTLTFTSYDHYKGVTYLTIKDGEVVLVGGRNVKTDKAVTKAIVDAQKVQARNDARKAAKVAKAVAAGREECQICAGDWAMLKGLTSFHGYTRPGYGWLVGGCMGAEQLPFSKSCDVLKKYRKVVADYKADQEVALAKCVAGKIKSITIEVKCANYYNLAKKDRRTESKTLTKVDGRDFESAISGRIRDLEFSIRGAGDELERVDARLALWVVKYGKEGK